MPAPVRTAAHLLASLVLAVGLASSCSTEDDETAEAPSAAAAEDLEAGEPEVFDGPDGAFYEVPDPLPPGEPGDLIRVQALEPDADADGTTTSLRIMYRSVDSTGADRAVTGVVTYPTAPPPEGGWVVTSSAHGTTGIAASCAPSRWLTAAPDHGVPGVHVATDYIGLGPVGELHPYLSGIDEGRSVIDAVRAARALPEANAGARWLAWGHSQGGHAALWAHELSETYAPELELLGTVALAPATELQATYGPLDEIVANIVSVMALYGVAPLHPELVPEDYVGDEVAALADVLQTACLGPITTTFTAVDQGTFYRARPQDTEPAASLFASSDPGDVAVDVPLLVVQGDQDIRVHPERTDDYVARACAAGQALEFAPFPGTDHDTVLDASSDRVTAWLADRVEGRPAGDDCP